MTTTPDAAPSETRRTRRWKLAFFASLAVNLMVAGIVGGALLKDPHDRRAEVRDLGFGPFTDALSDADRNALRKSFRERRPDFRAARVQMRADMTEMLSALRAEPFDPVRLSQAFDTQQARLADHLKLGQDLMRDRLAAMTDAERHAFADRLEQRITRLRPPRDERKGGQDDNH